MDNGESGETVQFSQYQILGNISRIRISDSLSMFNKRDHRLSREGQVALLFAVKIRLEWVNY